MEVAKSEIAKIAYIDGLRGIAALTVFFAHLIISTLPAVITFTPSEVRWPVEISIGLSPLGVLWNGNFGVCIFFVLSGYVLSDFCLHARISFPAKLVRRYFRLALPMLITSAFAWALLRLALYRNYDAATVVTHSGWLSMWYRFEPDFVFMVKESLYGAFANGQAIYNSNLWTMRYELIGSVYVFLVHALFKSKNIRLLVLLGFIWMNHKNYYALFACGVVLYELRDDISNWVVNSVRSPAIREAMVAAAFAFGVFMGSYPAVQPQMAAPWHDWLWSYKNEVAWHMIGAVIVLAALDQSRLLQLFFGSRLAVFFGKISFVLYLIHIPVVCSLGSAVVLALNGRSYPLIVAATWLITAAGVVGLSVLMYRYVDLYMTSFSRRAGRWFDSWFPPVSRPQEEKLLGQPWTTQKPIT